MTGQNLYNQLLGTVIVTTVVYWMTALTFVLMDFTQMPGFLMKYKIQPGKNAPPSTAKVIKVSCRKNIWGQYLA